MTVDGPSSLPLRDLHLPPPPDVWPPAPGWWLLAVVSVVLLIWSGFALYRYWRLQRWRGRILQTLDELNSEYPSGGQTALFLAQVSILLRRVAITRFSRRRVARLTGSDWLRFLDETGGDGRFSDGPGQALAYGPYQPQAISSRDELLALAKDWIVKNIDGRRLPGQ